MPKSFSINFNTLNVGQPIGGKEVFSDDVLGTNILCSILADMGYRIVVRDPLVHQVGLPYIEAIRELLIPELIGIPTGAAAEVIPISFASYLVQLTY